MEAPSLMWILQIPLTIVIEIYMWKEKWINHVTWCKTCTTTAAEESQLPGICLVGGSLNNWWRRLNIAARSIYPKHSRAVIYLKLSFSNRCFLLLLLGSCPSLIITNPGHLAFHYRHSGRKRRRGTTCAQQSNLAHTHTQRQSIDRHTHTYANRFCVMLKATVALLKSKMNWMMVRKMCVTCYCFLWFGLGCIRYKRTHTHTHMYL